MTLIATSYAKKKKKLTKGLKGVFSEKLNISLNK